MLIHKIDVNHLHLKRILDLHETPDTIILDWQTDGIIGPSDAALTKENAPLYERWDMYPIQYKWEQSAPVSAVSAVVEFSYDGVIESFKAKQSRVAYKLADEDAWHTVHTTVDEVGRLLMARLPVDAERISFAYNTAWYSKFTQHLANEYPVWTHARNSRKSNAQQFLNFFGITLEEVEAWIHWTRRQKYIETADLKQIDYAYVYKIPEEVDLDKPFKVSEIFEGVELQQILRTHDFMRNVTQPGYMLDKKEHQLFTRIAYGFLDIEQDDFEESMEPQMHHIWNTFDEFGLLLDVHRLPNESNEDLKERILDVFRYPAGANYLGLIYSITRETNKMKRIIWEDDSKPLYIKVNNKRVLHETVHLDHRPIEQYTYEDEFEISRPMMKVFDNGDIELHPENTGRSRMVTLVTDLFLFQLYDKENDEVYPILFEDNEQATDKLRHWVNQINQIAPSMWGYTRWDINYWDNIDEKGTGLGFIPNQYDSELDAWKRVDKELK